MMPFKMLSFYATSSFSGLEKKRWILKINEKNLLETLDEKKELKIVCETLC